MIIGLIIVAVGIYITLGGKLPPLFRLPGDIVYRGNNTTVFLPITTMILISIILNLIIRLLR
ncbi:DUF2905 domain-containing protein [Alkalicella caledoniensis]|uniref:DUF2905 domain-containing protein n=1 Tax=Alkalicella caledoniensis TaxID=2731377 RepID=UPI003CCD4CE6